MEYQDLDYSALGTRLRLVNQGGKLSAPTAKHKKWPSAAVLFRIK